MSTAQQIYTALRRAGLTEAGALGLMGNLQAESGLEACRLQGDFSSDRHKSREYAEGVDIGLTDINRASTDGLGWGLAQWTYSTRKRALILFCKARNASIADLNAQIDFLLRELADWPGLLRYLCETDDLFGAADRVCREFERPAINNVQARYQAAQQLRSQVSDDPAAPEPDPEPVSEYWPPRMLCEGMFGADVEALQAVLKARGYTLSDSLGIFGGSTADAVVRFQADHGLLADAVAGRKTWTELIRI